MNEFKIADVPEIKNSETEKFGMEKPGSSMSVKEARAFWDNRFKGGEETEQKEPTKREENQEQKVERGQEYYTTFEEREALLPKNGEWTGEPLEGVNKIAKTIENKGFSRKGKADGKNFVRWKPLHILERCKEKRQGKTAVRHGLGIVFKL